jgi:hypothetical protein
MVVATNGLLIHTHFQRFTMVVATSALVKGALRGGYCRYNAHAMSTLRNGDCCALCRRRAQITSMQQMNNSTLRDGHCHATDE